MLRLLPGATRRVLNIQLKELEEHGMVEKMVYPELPPKVEYSLTEIGRSLMPIIDAMNNDPKNKPNVKISLSGL